MHMIFIICNKNIQHVNNIINEGLFYFTYSYRMLESSKEASFKCYILSIFKYTFFQKNYTTSTQKAYTKKVGTTALLWWSWNKNQHFIKIISCNAMY
jgi:hypothetical protein